MINNDRSMKNYGFIRTAAAVPEVRVADTEWNAGEIRRLAGEAFEKGVSLVVFPELSLTGCTCADLFFQSLLIRKAEEGVASIVEFSRGKSVTIIAGAPVPYRSRLYDCAIVIRNGNIKGIVPKTFCTGEESRWFSSGSDFLSPSVRNDSSLLNNGKDNVREGYCGEIRYAGQKCNISPSLLFGLGEATFAIEIGTDLYSPVNPASYLALQGADIIVNPASENETVSSDKERKNTLKQHSSRLVCGYIQASAGFGESTQDKVYSGSASVWENGELIGENDRFCTGSTLLISDIDVEKLENLRRKAPSFRAITPDGTDCMSFYQLYNRINLGNPNETDFEGMMYRKIEPHPFTPSGNLDEICRETLDIQVSGLMRRLCHINCRTAVIGISGGLDSTLAILAAIQATDRLGWSRDRVIAVTMPGFGTSSRTKGNALELMQKLGVTCREISIVPSCTQHFKDIGHDISVHDATYENSQARERTQLLMDIANQTGGIVIGTGDLSELALGWATYNGDHMSMYGLNAGIPKTLVRNLVIWAAENRFTEVKEVLLDIADTPISPELLPADEEGNIRQVTEDLVGPYELHDFYIYNLMNFGFGPEKISFLAQKAFSYDAQVIDKWLKIFIRRFFSQQFKRSCMPDGPKTGPLSLSPRGGWSMPSDAWSTIFSKDLD